MRITKLIPAKYFIAYFLLSCNLTWAVGQTVGAPLTTGSSVIVDDGVPVPSATDCLTALGDVTEGKSLCVQLEADKIILKDIRILSNDLKGDDDLAPSAVNFTKIGNKLERSNEVLYDLIRKILKEKEIKS